MTASTAVPSRAKRFDRTAASLALVAAACVAQYVILLTQSLRAVRTGALTWDFAIAFQAWSGIARGHLDPYLTLRGFTYAHDHGSFILWPLALIAAIWPTPLALKTLQDVAIVATTAVTMLWARDVGRAVGNGGERLTLGFTCAACVANPWIYEGAAYDFHTYAFEALFVTALGRSLWNGAERQAVAFALLGLSCGDVACTGVASVAISFALFRRLSRRTAITIFIAACGWYATLNALGLTMGSHFLDRIHGGSKASLIGPVGALASVLGRPDFIVEQFTRQASIIEANLAPSGLVGAAAPFAIVPSIILIAAGVLPSNGGGAYSYPGDQNLPLYPIVTVGTAWCLTRLAGRAGSLREGRVRWAMIAQALLSVNAILWFSANYGGTLRHWFAVDPRAGAFIHRIADEIAPADEVIVSQGFAGLFGDRDLVYGFLSPRTYPLHAGRTFVILSASQGNETATREETSSAIASMLALPEVQILGVRAGVWAFLIDRNVPLSLDLSRRAATIPGVIVENDPTASELADRTAHLELRTGHEVRQFGWRRLPGNYRFSIRYRATSAFRLDVINGSTGESLGTRILSPGLHAARIAFTVTSHPPRVRHEGIAPFGYASYPDTRPDAIGMVLSALSSHETARVDLHDFGFDDDPRRYDDEIIRGPWNLPSR